MATQDETTTGAGLAALNLLFSFLTSWIFILNCLFAFAWKWYAQGQIKPLEPKNEEDVKRDKKYAAFARQDLK
jgi:hypothetical protein